MQEYATTPVGSPEEAQAGVEIDSLLFGLPASLGAAEGLVDSCAQDA
jgi:hypothetical protein